MLAQPNTVDPQVDAARKHLETQHWLELIDGCAFTVKADSSSTYTSLGNTVMDLIVSSVSGTCTRTERLRSEGKSLLFRIYRCDQHVRHPVLPLAMEAGRYHRKLLQMVRCPSPLEGS